MGVLLPEAWVSSRAGGLGLLNPHQYCFHCSSVSVCFVLFSPQCLFLASLCMLLYGFLFSYSTLISALHSLVSGGSRVSFQSLECKSRCQNEGVANVSHMLLEPKFLRPPGWVQRWGTLKDVTESLCPCSSLMCPWLEFFKLPGNGDHLRRLSSSCNLSKDREMWNPLAY